MPSPAASPVRTWTSCASGRPPSRNRLLLLIALVAIASALLSTSCVPRQAILPDPAIPHRVAAETVVEVWARRPDGQLVRERVRLLPDWWVASPQVVDPPTVPR